MIDSIDQDVKITLVDKTQRRMNEEDMFGVNDLDGDEVIVDVTAGENVEQSTKDAEKEVSTTDPVTTAAKLKAITNAAITITVAGTRPKAKGIVMQEPSKRSTPTPIYSSQKPSKAKDKGKGKMVEPEKPLKRKDQIIIDEEFAKNLEAQTQAELEKEERLARLKEEETNIALVAEWDNIQVMMDVDCELAARLQEEERGELSIEENSRLFILFNNTIKWIEAFVLMDTELEKGNDKAVENSEKAEEGSSKRTGSKLEQEDVKRRSQSSALETFYSCGVHCITTKNMVYYLLVEKMYPFTRNFLHQKWNDVRLQVDYEVEMAYDLLRLIRKHINEGYVPELSVWIHPLMKIKILINKLEDSKGEH
nr:hypothetical protein [Tanacetum cinerariifolium]